MTESNIKELMSNVPKVFTQAADVLIKICANVLKDPLNTKYRSISLSSATFCQKLLPADGALSCLFDIGFVEGTDSLILPASAPLEKLKQMHDVLIARKVDASLENKQDVKKSKGAQPSDPQVTSGSVRACPPATASTSQQPLESTFKASQSETKKASQLSQIKSTIANNFLLKVLHYSDFVLQYEDASLQRKAIQCVPILELNSNVENAIRSIQEAYKKKEVASEHENCQELLLLALLSWFKKDFFTWVDKPPCHACSSEETECRGARESSHHSMNRIEVFACKKCGEEVLFPRYNDPNELLKSRRGRCGEWANCFTLICRAMGWDARLVVDETDHVWTEVYLSIPKRWVHCDPCEGVLDAPLMYESGWGKKLTYVMAYSHEEVQDVTWRYSSHHRDVLQRRVLATEDALFNVIVQIRAVKMENLSQARQNFLLKRTVEELADMLMERSASASELQGRSSGSLAWRHARGETGTLSTSHIWRVKPSEVQNGIAVFGYSAARDCYVSGEDMAMITAGWSSGVFHAQDIQLKVEKDWKMSYLARSEGCDKSQIAWRFELCDGLSLENVSIVFKTAIYHSGSISIRVCCGDICVQLPKGSDVLETNAFVDQQQLEITAELSGGDGNCAWQHTQLFRQSTEDKSSLPFMVTLCVKQT